MSNCRSKILACFLMAILLVVNLLSAQFSGGNGYPDNPWQIKTEGDVYALNGYMGTNFIDEPYMNFKLMNDVTLNNPAILPLGAYDNPFFGVFDGNGFTISINAGSSSLFAHLQPQATVKNLSVDAFGSSGFIAVYSMGTITDCIVYGGITGGDQVGAVVNSNDGAILNCDAHCSVSGGSQVGGIAGLNGGDIINCKNYSDITATGSSLGGIAGENGGTITRSYNYGLITVNNDKAGGIAGYSPGDITQSLNTGDIVANSTTITRIGGIVGYGGGYISEVGNTGNLIGSMSAAGGVAGMNEGTVVNSYSTGDVSLGFNLSQVGSLIGWNVSAPINYCYASGRTTFQPLIGLNTGADGHDSYYNIDNVIQFKNGRSDYTGTPKTTAELKRQPTYNGWDFMQETANGTSDIWGINPTINNGYPFLKWQGNEHVEAFFAAGNGSANDPYQVTTPAQLSLLRYYLERNDLYFKLVNDLDLSSYLTSGAGFSAWGAAGWLPIGTNVGSFTGKFDGNGKKVSGLFINRPDLSGAGLFSFTDNGCEIKNLSVELQAAGIRAYHWTGGIAGWANYSSFKNCSVSGAVNGNSVTGSLVGSCLNGLISGCYSSGTVNGETHIGGIVGLINFSEVKNCYSTSQVNGVVAKTGGLTGTCLNSTITNSYFNGIVSDTAVPSGAMVGYQDGNSTISNSFWNSTLNPSPALANGLGLAKSSAELKNQATYTDWDFTTTPIWHLVANENNGFPHLAWQQLTPPSAVEETKNPLTTALFANYPNPFNPTTAISYQLSAMSDVQLAVYNAKGEWVKTLVNCNQSAGSYSVNFDGAGLNSGVYFYKLEADGKSMVKRMLMVK